MAPAPAQAPAKKSGVDFRHPGGKEFLILGGAALGLGLLYFWWKGRQQQQQGQGAGKGGGGRAGSPTAVFSAWLQDHAGTGAGGGGDGDHPGRGQVAVPKVTGLTDTAADAAITAVGLQVGDTNEPKGGFGHTATVASQSPSAGVRVKHGSKVNLTFNEKKTSGDHGEA